jgi:hypothetical protein
VSGMASIRPLGRREGGREGGMEGEGSNYMMTKEVRECEEEIKKRRKRKRGQGRWCGVE